VIAPHLSKPLRETALQEALTAARAIAKEESRAQALTALAPHLSEPSRETVLQEALTAAWAITDGGTNPRAQALTALAPHLSAPLLQEALATARAIENRHSRSSILAGLAPYVKRLPIVRLYALWCETLPTLATRTRPDLLSDLEALASMITALGGQEALSAMGQAIVESGKWFP
jgi:hypothetical protein